MKKILLLFLAIILLSGCQKNEKYELIFEPKSLMNCYNFIYEFSDGTKVYSYYENIKYKTENTEISIKDALKDKKIKLSDLEENGNFRIVRSGEKLEWMTCTN